VHADQLFNLQSSTLGLSMPESSTFNRLHLILEKEDSKNKPDQIFASPIYMPRPHHTPTYTALGRKAAKIESIMC
jgi:hypothetical protein